MPPIAEVAARLDVRTAPFSIIRLHGPDRAGIEEQTGGVKAWILTGRELCGNLRTTLLPSTRRTWVHAERRLMKRLDDNFLSMLDGFQLETLEGEPNPVYGLSADRTLSYLNPGWFIFARENGGEPAISERFGIGTFIGDAMAGKARGFYLEAFQGTLTGMIRMSELQPSRGSPANEPIPGPSTNTKNTNTTDPNASQPLERGSRMASMPSLERGPGMRLTTIAQSTK